MENFNFATEANEWKRRPLHHQGNNCSIIKLGDATNTCITHSGIIIVKHNNLFSALSWRKLPSTRHNNKSACPDQKKNCWMFLKQDWEKQLQDNNIVITLEGEVILSLHLSQLQSWHIFFFLIKCFSKVLQYLRPFSSVFGYINLLPEQLFPAIACPIGLVFTYHWSQLIQCLYWIVSA